MSDSDNGQDQNAVTSDDQQTNDNQQTLTLDGRVCHERASSRGHRVLND